MCDPEDELRSYVEKNPQAIDFTLFESTSDVDEYLQYGTGRLRHTMEVFLDLSRVQAADLFGISWSDVCGAFLSEELHVNLYLCWTAALKFAFPKCKTAAGGLLRSWGTSQELYVQALNRCPQLDYAVDGPGEDCLEEIVGQLDGKPIGHSGKVYAESHGSGLYLRATNAIVPQLGGQEPQRLDIEPLFLGRELFRLSGAAICNRYQIPQEVQVEIGEDLQRSVLVLPYRFTSGCVGRCSYCSGPGPFTGLPPAEAVRAIAHLQEKYETNCFRFLNYCLNSNYDYALAFARELAAARLGIIWSDSVRGAELDEQLIDALVESGMTQITLGVETGSDRLLKLMHRPGNAKRHADALRMLHSHGVWNGINIIAGLPTESADDVDATLRLIEDTWEYVDVYSVIRFRLDYTSAIVKNPQRYGIEIHADTRMLVGETLPDCDIDGVRYLVTPFENIEGRSWAENERALFEAYNAYCGKIKSLGGDPHGFYHEHLWYWLYAIYGRENKAKISEIARIAMRGWARINGLHRKDDLAEPVDAAREANRRSADDKVEVTLPAESPAAPEREPATDDGTVGAEDAPRADSEAFHIGGDQQETRAGTLRLTFEDLTGKLQSVVFFITAARPGDKYYLRKNGVGMWYVGEVPPSVRDAIGRFLARVISSMERPPTLDSVEEWESALGRQFAATALATRLRLTIS